MARNKGLPLNRGMGVMSANVMRIPFDYLLVDSWFTCTELVDFVYRRHKKFHLLGMAKMGNTKYMTTDWGDMLKRLEI